MDSNFRFPAVVSFVVVPFRGVPPIHGEETGRKPWVPFIMRALDDAELIFSVTRLDTLEHKP